MHIRYIIQHVLFFSCSFLQFLQFILLSYFQQIICHRPTHMYVHTDTHYIRCVQVCSQGHAGRWIFSYQDGKGTVTPTDALLQNTEGGSFSSHSGDTCNCPYHSRGPSKQTQLYRGLGHLLKQTRTWRRRTCNPLSIL